VRRVSPQERPELVIYVENGGDFTVPFTAIRAVESGTVILDCGKLAYGLRRRSVAPKAQTPRV